MAEDAGSTDWIVFVVSPGNCCALNGAAAQPCPEPSGPAESRVVWGIACALRATGDGTGAGAVVSLFSGCGNDQPPEAHEMRPISLCASQGVALGVFSAVSSNVGTNTQKYGFMYEARQVRRTDPGRDARWRASSAREARVCQRSRRHNAAPGATTGVRVRAAFPRSPCRSAGRTFGSRSGGSGSSWSCSAPSATCSRFHWRRNPSWRQRGALR